MRLFLLAGVACALLALMGAPNDAQAAKSIHE